MLKGLNPIYEAYVVTLALEDPLISGVYGIAKERDFLY
jgi:hypothetical protein